MRTVRALRKKRENLGARSQVFQKTFHFKARTEKKRYSACVSREKLMTDIDTDKLAVASDCPFLMCVFYVPSNKMISL